jgi:hypothetical protein
MQADVASHLVGFIWIRISPASTTRHVGSNQFKSPFGPKVLPCLRNKPLAMWSERRFLVGVAGFESVTANQKRIDASAILVAFASRQGKDVSRAIDDRETVSRGLA